MRVREPEPQAPPRFMLIRTEQGNVALAGAALPEATASQLLRLAGQEPPLGEPLAPPHYLDGYLEALKEDGGGGRTWSGPAFVLPLSDGPPEGTLRITNANAGLLERNFAWALRHLDSYNPICAIEEDGAAVSLCFAAREPSAGVEAGVHTVEAYRGRGYAKRVVATWAYEVARSGSLPLYSTSWDNPACRNIAERLGAKLYGVDFSIT
jgi:GNAT superfamily N-acetyltransferase